jgi:hypothetical protein
VGLFHAETVTIATLRLLNRMAVLVFWFFLWIAIPAGLLYPLALWMARHTQISSEAIANGYGVAIALLWLPTGFLVHFIYRRFVRDRRSKKSVELSERSS